LEQANIIVDCGVRLGANELTRRGKKENEVQEVAEFIKRALKDCENPRKVKLDIAKFVGDFSED